MTYSALSGPAPRARKLASGRGAGLDLRVDGQEVRHQVEGRERPHVVDDHGFVKRVHDVRVGRAIKGGEATTEPRQRRFRHDLPADVPVSR